MLINKLPLFFLGLEVKHFADFRTFASERGLVLWMIIRFHSNQTLESTRARDFLSNLCSSVLIYVNRHGELNYVMIRSI